MDRTGDLTIEVFDAAAQGDLDAIDTILDAYAEQLNAVCTVKTRKRNGMVVSHIDEDMRQQIKRRLIADLPTLAAKMHAEYDVPAHFKD